MSMKVRYHRLNSSTLSQVSQVFLILSMTDQEGSSSNVWGPDLIKKPLIHCTMDHIQCTSWIHLSDITKGQNEDR